MYHLHTRLPKTDERSRDCRRFRLEGKKEPGGVEDQRIVLQLRVKKQVRAFWCNFSCSWRWKVCFGAVLISFFTFSMSYGKNLTSKMGGQSSFSASTPKASANCLKRSSWKKRGWSQWNTQIAATNCVSLWIFFHVFSHHVGVERCVEIHRMFCFYDCSWPSAGLWECFTPFILHRSTCIMSFEGDSVYSILFRKKSYHNMMWQGALCENPTSFCCKG